MYNIVTKENKTNETKKGIKTMKKTAFISASVAETITADFVPTTKSELTKSVMIQYVYARRNRDDILWYKETVAKYTKERKSNFDKTVFKDVELKSLRKDFIKRFFPELGKSKVKHETFLEAVDELDALLAELEAEETENIQLVG